MCLITNVHPIPSHFINVVASKIFVVFTTTSTVLPLDSVGNRYPFAFQLHVIAPNKASISSSPIILVITNLIIILNHHRLTLNLQVPATCGASTESDHIKPSTHTLHWSIRTCKGNSGFEPNHTFPQRLSHFGWSYFEIKKSRVNVTLC